MVNKIRFSRLTLRLEEDLVRVLIGKPDDLVFDGGAVAGPPGLHPPPVGGGLVQVLADQLVGGRRRARQVAAQLLPVHMGLNQGIF